VATEDAGEQQRAQQGRVAELEAELAAREAELAARDAKVAKLEAIVAELTTKIEELTEKLGRNSTNSHLPPSSDGPGATSRGKRRKKSKKGKKGRKRGGQKGHRGAHRQLAPTEQVDEFIHLFPSACEGCAAPLPQEPGADPKRYQVIDLLVGGGSHLTEVQRHEHVCERCGHRTTAPYDAERITASPFGPRLTAVVAMLTGVYHLSRRRAQQLLREIFGVQISLGAISTLESRASEGLVDATNEAKREVEKAPAKHTDATSWLLAGITMSLWTMTSRLATVYKIFEDGRRTTVQPWFGELIGILVSDRTSVVDFWAMALRQICHAHLIRQFVLFSERDGAAGTIGRELLDLSALVFHYWHGFKAGQLTRAELQLRMRPVQRQFEAALERAVAADIPRLSGSCADILEHREALWNFVTHDGVEPTNNEAELALRPLVLWRKRSYGCQSKRGLRFVERIMTVVQTARKLGKDVLDFIVRCVDAKVRGTLPPSLLPRPP
jgi:transposase